jgi:hypothetical protein
MKGDRIAYISGIKYWLATDYVVQTDVRPPYDIKTEYIDLNMEGLLTIRHAYPWDGPSGGCPDIPQMMRGSLAHDAFADLMRQGYLDFNKYFHAINRELEKIADEDGLPDIACHLVFKAVDEISDGSWAKYGEDGGRKLCFAP